MIDYFKKRKRAHSKKNKDTDPISDKSFFIILALFLVIILYSIIKAQFDPYTASQVRKLHISAFDVSVLAISVIGYFVFKGRGKK